MLEVVLAAGIAPANEEVRKNRDSQPAALDPDTLDAVQGGIAVPTGGSVREQQSQYTWLGMTYTQTHRTAYDADGSVVGTELNRPGSVWSDTTTTNASGTRTTYDTGGNGLAAQFSTQHDADGRFQGAGFDARANVSVDDFNLTGNLRGGFDVGRDEAGNFSHAAATVHGDTGIAHEPSGVGVRVTGEASLAGNLVRDGEGNIMGAGVRVDASAPLDLTYQGDRVVGVDLVGIHGDINGRGSEDGTFDGNVAATFTRMGTSIGGDAYLHSDGSNTLFGANADYQRQALGPYGAQARTSVGVDGALGDNPELSARLTAQANLFGQELAGTNLTATLDGDGLRTESDLRHIDVPVPSLPSANPTGLPGTSETTESTPTPSAPLDVEEPEPQAAE